jgi:hypothetical protein
MTRLPAPPPGSGAAGKRHWRTILGDYELSGGDLEVLREIVVVADQIEALRPMMALGPFIKGPDGQPRTNPAVVQFRLMVLVKARLMAAIRVIGDTADDEHDRPQRRVGVKGVYTGTLKAVK